MPSPTRRTLHLLRQTFQYVQVVEQYLSHAKRSRDLYRCIDILCIGTDSTIGVQCTSAANHGARKEKILRTPAMKAWLRAKQQLWIISWGKKKGRWVENIEMIRIEDFDAPKPDAR